jgi:integrase
MVRAAGCICSRAAVAHVDPLVTFWLQTSREIKRLTFQALRRTFATHFHRIGTVKDQQSEMRHSDAQTTINVYTQRVSETLKAALEEFDRKMGKSS